MNSRSVTNSSSMAGDPFLEVPAPPSSFSPASVRGAVSTKLEIDCLFNEQTEQRPQIDI